MVENWWHFRSGSTSSNISGVKLTGLPVWLSSYVDDKWQMNVRHSSSESTEKFIITILWTCFCSLQCVRQFQVRNAFCHSRVKVISVPSSCICEQTLRITICNTFIKYAKKATFDQSMVAMEVMCWVGKHQHQHINVHCVKNFCTHMKCEVKHNGDMGMGP